MSALSCPADLTELLRRFVAEEATSVLRHDIRNRLTSLRNGAYYVHRRLEKETALVEKDPRLLKFLAQIDEEAGTIADMLSSRLPPPAEVAPAECGLDEVTALLESSALPRRVTLSSDGKALRVKGNAAELQVALYCLVEASQGSSQRAPHVRVEAREGGWVALEVDPGFPAGDEGVGLKISRRVAERWGGALELVHSEHGSHSALKLRLT